MLTVHDGLYIIGLSTNGTQFDTGCMHVDHNRRMCLKQDTKKTNPPKPQDVNLRTQEAELMPSKIQNDLSFPKHSQELQSNNARRQLPFCHMTIS